MYASALTTAPGRARLGHFLLGSEEAGAARKVEGYGVAGKVSPLSRYRQLRFASDVRLIKHARNEGKVVRMMPALMQLEPEPKQ